MEEGRLTEADLKALEGLNSKDESWRQNSTAHFASLPRNRASEIIRAYGSESTKLGITGALFGCMTAVVGFITLLGWPDPVVLLLLVVYLALVALYTSKARQRITTFRRVHTALRLLQGPEAINFAADRLRYAFDADRELDILLNTAHPPYSLNEVTYRQLMRNVAMQVEQTKGSLPEVSRKSKRVFFRAAHCLLKFGPIGSDEKYFCQTMVRYADIFFDAKWAAQLQQAAVGKDLGKDEPAASGYTT